MMNCRIWRGAVAYNRSSAALYYSLISLQSNFRSESGRRADRIPSSAILTGERNKDSLGQERADPKAAERQAANGQT